MKLRELHLKAFGAFTDRTLDLSGGAEGLHLIHGPNEAGKSTALRAITQLLYGMGTRTNDDFVHPQQQLRIGATLSNGNDSLTFYRRKGNKNTLLSPDEKKKLADDALAPFLDGVDAAAFVNFFGLSHEQLVRGGEGLIQGEGDVGQALFSAAAGMGNLRTLLGRLEDGAGEFFSPRASKPRINSALSQLKELRKEIRAIQLSSTEWQALDTERRDAAARRAAVDEELQAARAEEGRLQRVLDALPLVSQRTALRAKLEPLQDAVVLPEDFAERRHQSQADALNAETVREAAAKALATHETALADIAVNDGVLAHEDLIEELNERRAQNQKALHDRDHELAPALQRLEEEAEHALHHLRPHWTLDQVEDLRLAPGQERRVHDLSRAGEALKVQHANAEAAVKKLQREQARLREDLDAAGAAMDPSGVERALKQAIQSGALADDLAARQREMAAQAQAIDAGIARLGLWSGTPESFESLAVPSSSTIERFRVDLDDAARQVESAREKVVALAEDLQHSESQLNAYQKAHDAPSLEALEKLRALRHEGWQQARAAWESGTKPGAISDKVAQAWLARAREQHPDADNLADAYAALVEDSDIMADRLRNEADRVAARAQLESNVAALEAQRTKGQAAQAEQERALTALETDWVKAWEPAGIAPRSPREMAEWKQAHADLLAAIAELRALTVTAEAHTANETKLRDALLQALDDAGAEGPGKVDRLPDLVAHGETWVAAQRQQQQERKQLETSLAQLQRDGLPDAEAELERTANALAEWRTDWAAVAENLGAPGDAAAGEILALLEAINGLLARAAEAKEVRGRIARIDRDDQQFRDAVQALLEVLGGALDGPDAAAQVQALYAELKQSRAARQERDQLKKLRDAEAERLREADATLARVAREQEALCTEAGVADVASLPAAERDSRERQALEKDLRALDAQLAGLSAGAGVEALLAMAAEEDGDTLAPRLEALGTRIEDLDDERLALQEQLGRLDEQLRRMDGSDAAAALEEEAQQLLAAIAEDTEQYARLRVAAHVLRTSIERYREANQEPLLARAGAIFQRLTLGSFAELRADVDEKDQHVLCGVRPDSDVLVKVDGMSEGTADQLYLALRLASLERHLESHPPIPFILDDILVNFDDARSVAALEVLAEVSDRTQVIYFTHHAHLVELAKECVDKQRLFVQPLAG